MRILAALLFVTACAVPPVESEGQRPAREGEGEEGEGEDGEVEFGDGASGDVCSFNADCGRDLRCGCDEETGCLCEAGARGRAPLGDNCLDENDCASAVCLEDDNAVFACSAACVDDSDCIARLPRCTDVAFVGRICIRDGSGGGGGG